MATFVATRARARLAAALYAAALLAACGAPTSPKPPLLLYPPLIGTTLAQYQIDVARWIETRNPSFILHGTPQAMLRSLVVVSFVVDRNGRLVHSAVYRSNGDDEAEHIALDALRRAMPLPAPPAGLLDGNGRVEMMETWLFNDNGQFQLRLLAAPQAQTLN